MSGAVLSFLGGWWTRLFGRADSARQPPATPPPSALPPSDAPVPVKVATEPAPRKLPAYFPASASGRVATAEEREAARAQAERSLAETLQLDSLPAAARRNVVIDPKARERTLAALENLQQIPALQSLAQGFTQAMNRPDVALDEVVAAIAKDSALCVRVLRMANSVLVSPERKIEDLDTAVQMLGVKRVRQAAQALFTLRDANRVADGFDWRHLWIHALATAAVAEELEAQLRSREDPQLHLAALLHDVGKIVLSTIAPDDYRDILVTTWNEDARLEDLERARLGVDHREAGVLFAQHNGMPAMVIAAIAHHDRPGAAESHRFEVALVAIANYVSKAHGLGFSGARLDERDGELGELPAWKVIAEERGGPVDVAAVEAELDDFIAGLRADLRELRESA